MPEVRGTLAVGEYVVITGGEQDSYGIEHLGLILKPLPEDPNPERELFGMSSYNSRMAYVEKLVDEGYIELLKWDEYHL